MSETTEAPDVTETCDTLVLQATVAKLERAEKRVEYWRGVADGLVVAIAVVVFVAIFQRVV